MNTNAEAVLRQAAAEIRAQGINGWGNACEAGADRIRNLEMELAALLAGPPSDIGEPQSMRGSR